MSDEKADEINPSFQKEWETSRTLLSFFDDKLYDLRKYGFSFITALIAATSVLITGLSTTGSWPDEVKFAILFVTIILIVAVTVIDRNFTVIQRAAADRARLLERNLNLELSEVITQRYRSAGAGIFATVLYVFLMVAVLVLGNFSLSHNGIYFWVLMLAGIASILGMFAIRNYIKVDYPYGQIDWTIDRLRCTEGDKVGITLTNLSEKKRLTISANDASPTVMWEIRKEGETTADSKDKGTIKSDLTIAPGDSYTWLWQTDKCCGVYRVFRLTLPKKTLVAMMKKLVIKEKTSKPQADAIQVKLVKT